MPRALLESRRLVPYLQVIPHETMTRLSMLYIVYECDERLLYK